MFALALRDGRRQQHQGGSLRVLKDGIDHLAHCLGRQIDVVVGAARRAGARVQKAQVVVDFRDGSDGGARVVGSRFLLDRYGGRQALDGVDVRLLHHREELPGIGRQRLDVAALAFRIDGVERERGFAGPREAREHDQPIARQVQVDILQVVGPGAPDSDILHVTNYYTRRVKRG